MSLGSNCYLQTAHWAEQIFSLPLPSRTPLKHQRSLVLSHGFRQVMAKQFIDPNPSGHTYLGVKSGCPVMLGFFS